MLSLFTGLRCVMMGCILCLAGMLKAQSDVIEDVLTLKDGSIIRGQIIEQSPGESLKIELIGGSRLVINQADIREVRQEPSHYRKVIRRINHYPFPILVRNEGIYVTTALQFGFRNNRWGWLRIDPAFQFRAGHRLSRFLNLGAGLSFDIYEGGLLMPLFAEINGDLWAKRMTPHYLIQVGKGFGVSPSWPSTGIKGGLMTYIGLGYKIRTRRKLEYIFSLGYKTQSTTELQNQWGTGPEPILIERRRTYRGMVWQWALSF